MRIKYFYEVGPGKVLFGLNKRIDKTIKTVNVGTLEDINNINV